MKTHSDCDCRSHNGFLTAKGLEEAAQQLSLEGLDPLGVPEYLDKVGSVSGLELERDFHVWDDHVIEQQHRRFHNGS